MHLFHTGEISAFKSTSFMNSFKDLQNAGQQATLHFENKAGQAWTTVNLALDCTIEFKNLKLKPWANINLEEGVKFWKMWRIKKPGITLKRLEQVQGNQACLKIQMVRQVCKNIKYL